MKPLTPDIDLRHSSSRRAYVAPSLTSYGLVQDLTQAGSGGSSESANPCPNSDFTKKPNASCPSDSRIKTNIRSLSASPSGLPLYLFEYKPEFKSECGHGTYLGFMAQEVLQRFPSAVVTRPDGYYAIDYTHLRQLLH